MVRRHRRFARLAAGLIVAMTAFVMPGAAQADCTDLLPQGRPVVAHKRAITAMDLVRLRDIGSDDAADPDDPEPLALSPDGRQLAFVLRRADPAHNDYCQALVVLSLASGAPRIVDRGGDFMTLHGFIRGLYAEIGAPETVRPIWSRDGTLLYYLKRRIGRTQLWRVAADGAHAVQMTHSPFDIEAVVRVPESGALLVSARPMTSAVRRAITSEANNGWRYDARIMPSHGPRPAVRERDVPLEIFVVDRRDGALSPASPLERRQFADAEAAADGATAIAPNGTVAHSVAITPRIVGPHGVLVRRQDGTELTCPDGRCDGRLTEILWDRAGRDVVFLRRQGWNDEDTGLYRWTPGSGTPTLVLDTADALQNCVAGDDALYCTDEDVRMPRRIVRVDMTTGARTTVFDPNPEFRSIALGRVARLRWRNNAGLPAWGDLVLPPGFTPGHKLPMVVVQYHSRGFLRGGTGNAYPIYLLAARGIAVLSLERPPFIGTLDPHLTSIAAINRDTYSGWREHKSLLASLQAGVAAALATGAIDRHRLGITGLSDGDTVTQFALINTRLFRAAAISTCCLDPMTAMTYGGIAWAEENLQAGLPGVNRRDRHVWAPVSLAQNAQQIDTPILMQLADEEYLLGLETLEALREAGKPVDLFVFPGEHHITWQPLHRLAIFRRSLDWFDFWLKGHEDPDPAKRAQYRRWEQMRARQASTARAQASASARRRMR
ncbi:Atxe2 family lasso peptide isopeptidase [Sphingomonas koreensis]|nr:Atxe2 family lasso peptide isopeptidase [Sphingomonas koreensis]